NAAVNILHKATPTGQGLAMVTS
ncbi:transposase, partial [Lactobacillus helveticus]|nr:transposase [Lactobacillus helveticus]